MMSSRIINEIFLMFILAFMGSVVGVYSSVKQVNIMYFLLLIVCCLFLSFYYKQFLYRLKERILNFIDFSFIKSIVLFVLLWISVKYIYIDGFNNFFVFVNDGLLVMGIFYFIYDSQCIKYKLIQNKNELKSNNTHNYL